MIVLPAKSASETSLRSVLYNLNEGAFDPGAKGITINSRSKIKSQQLIVKKVLVVSSR